MARTVVISLIDGTEYYVNTSNQVTAFVNPLTGRRTDCDPSGSWTIKGVWFNKLLGKGFMPFNDFLSAVATGKVRFSDSKGLCKYGLTESKDGTDTNIGPLFDKGISFLKM